MRRGGFLLILLVALLGDTAKAPAASAPLPAGFVYLSLVAAGIAQDIRYAETDNFTGRPLPGYGAAECILRREAAIALTHAQAILTRQGFSLKVYDCYRPVRAVQAMSRWAHDGTSKQPPTKRFYPALEKSALFGLGYISAASRHSTGLVVDLTLTRPDAPAVATFNPSARYGSCIGPAAGRAPDSGVDMGTGFDCFDTKSHTRNPAIVGEPQKLRAILVAAMHAAGFRNYFREWWHFEYDGAASAPRLDFPILPLP